MFSLIKYIADSLERNIKLKKKTGQDVNRLWEKNLKEGDLTSCFSVASKAKTYIFNEYFLYAFIYLSIVLPNCLQLNQKRHSLGKKNPNEPNNNMKYYYPQE